MYLMKCGYLALLPLAVALRERSTSEVFASQQEWQCVNSSFTVSAADSKCVTKLQKDYCCSSHKDGKCTDGKRSLCDEDAGMQCSLTFRGYQCRCQNNRCYHSETKQCMTKEDMMVLTKGKGRPMHMRVEDALQALMGIFGGSLGAVGTVLGTVFSPFQKMAKYGAMAYAGRFARRTLNKDIEKVEKWLHYVMASFVLDHDDSPRKYCNKASSLSIGSAKVDYGKCFLSLANEDGAALWEGPIYSYSDGRGNDFNISLMVKANQIRCLEKLQVQKSRCFGNLIVDGGVCQLELAPPNDCPLNVTDLEVEIYCEGRCKVQDHVKSMLTWGESDNALEIGRKVYIWKETSRVYAKKCKGELMTITRSLSRCDAAGEKCLRHCLVNANGTPKGCWNAENLLTERYCESWWKYGARKALAAIGSWVNTETSHSKVTLLYRKFNAILQEVKVRTDVYIFRTRSLESAIKEDADDDRNPRTEKGIKQSFEDAFGSLHDATFGRIWSEKNATQKQVDLIKQYDFNMQPKRDASGNFTGYELVSCKLPTWNNDTQAYDKPPLQRCQKIRLVNLQVLATEENYLEIEELSSSQHQQSSVTGGSPGIVLSLIMKVARMMFVRHTATLSALDSFGKRKFCKDMWTPGKTPEKSYAVGVDCSVAKTDQEVDEDEVPSDGVDARFEFEFVEMQPVWNQELGKNQQRIGIRGGYNLNWCRVLTAKDPKTHLEAGSLVCDLDLPTHEGSTKLLNATLPWEAQFRLEQTGKNDLPSSIVISPGASEDSCSGNCQADESYVKNKVSDDLFDAASYEETLSIRLVSMLTGKYCKTGQQTFRKWSGLSTKKKTLMSCNVDSEATDSNLLSLWGSTDALTPSKYWNMLIALSLSCLGGGLAFTGSKWAALLGGAGVVFTFTTAVVGAAAGVAGGMYLSEYLSDNYHIDGIMLRYMMNDKLQHAGQGILYLVESALDFEVPRP